MTSPWQEWKAKNLQRQETGEVRPWDFLNPETEYVEEEVAEGRLAVCTDCPHFLKTQQCTKCGCFMPVKVKLKYSRCPEGLWN